MGMLLLWICREGTMNYIKKMFSDSKGNPSSGRINATIVVIAGIVYLFVNKSATDAAIIIGAGLAAKTVAGALE